jgi:phosphoribosyl 1,2-cyclic phosphodiesterase
MYNVGLGDCIYLRVPDKNKQVHILIDCGNKYSDGKLLEECITKLKAELPKVEGKPHLDLLVVSHPHEDHHKGFEEATFFDMKIDHLDQPGYDERQPGSGSLPGCALR